MRRPINHVVLVGITALGLLWAGRGWAHEDAPAASAGAAGSTTTASPATTATTATSATDASTSEKLDPTVEKWAGRFKGSSLIIDQSITPDTIAPGVQLSAVPSYQWWFSFRPRYYITPKFSIRARADLTVEVLNGSDTTYLHEAVFGDVWLDGVYSGIPKFGGIDTAVGLRLTLPTSKAAWARGNILGISAVLNFNRVWETRGGDFSLGFGAVAGTTIPSRLQSERTDGTTYDCQTTDAGHSSCAQIGAGLANAFQLTLLGSFGYRPIKRFGLGISYILIDAWAYNLPTGTVSSPTGGSATYGPSGNDTRLRENQWFLASLDGDATDWLNLSLGYYVYTGILAPNSTYRNPLWAPGGDTRIFFSVTIGFDQLYASIANREAKRKKAAAASTTTSSQLAHAMLPLQMQ